jgi:hypothetical protein
MKAQTKTFKKYESYSHSNGGKVKSFGIVGAVKRKQFIIKDVL